MDVLLAPQRHNLHLIYCMSMVVFAIFSLLVTLYVVPRAVAKLVAEIATSSTSEPHPHSAIGNDVRYEPVASVTSVSAK